MQANTPRPCKTELVALAGRALELERRCEAPPRLRRSVAEVIDRLAKVALRIAERLARLPHHQAHQRRAISLEQIGGAVEDGGAGLAAQGVPVLRGGLGCGERPVDGRRIGGAAGADDDPAVMRRGDVDGLDTLQDLA